MNRSVQFVAFLLIVALWLTAGCAIHVVPAGAGFATGNVPLITTTRPTAANNFHGCAQVCNAMAVCTTNQNAFAQMARSVGAYCAVTGNAVIGSTQIVQNGNQNQNNGRIYNCKSGGTGTASECTAQDARLKQVPCRQGGTQPTVELCQQQDLQRLRCAKDAKVLCRVLDNEPYWYDDEKNVISQGT